MASFGQGMSSPLLGDGDSECPPPVERARPLNWRLHLLMGALGGLTVLDCLTKHVGPKARFEPDAEGVDQLVLDYGGVPAHLQFYALRTRCVRDAVLTVVGMSPRRSAGPAARLERAVQARYRQVVRAKALAVRLQDQWPAEAADPDSGDLLGATGPEARPASDPTLELQILETPPRPSAAGLPPGQPNLAPAPPAPEAAAWSFTPDLAGWPTLASGRPPPDPTEGEPSPGPPGNSTKPPPPSPNQSATPSGGAERRAPDTFLKGVDPTLLALGREVWPPDLAMSLAGAGTQAGYGPLALASDDHKFVVSDVRALLESLHFDTVNCTMAPYGPEGMKLKLGQLELTLDGKAVKVDGHSLKADSWCEVRKFPHDLQLACTGVCEGDLESAEALVNGTLPPGDHQLKPGGHSVASPRCARFEKYRKLEEFLALKQVPDAASFKSQGPKVSTLKAHVLKVAVGGFDWVWSGSGWTRLDTVTGCSSLKLGSMDSPHRVSVPVDQGVCHSPAFVVETPRTTVYGSGAVPCPLSTSQSSFPA